MQIDIGGICAKCFSCGGTDFIFLRPRPDHSADKLACGGCSTEVLFDDLRSRPNCDRAKTSGELFEPLSRRYPTRLVG
jgi:hypothetical protein